ncbi:hypothetical protein Ahy_B02g057633 [Arachis hypogaea]|uniref:Glutamate decarboxylase n=1 Tax=Arachis hypogaea TaxID=3818 RepID=A0A445ACB1_ARAHY|nr:hypothetical protein Ahy_B02g057633 [Arachis hypogaea]
MLDGNPRLNLTSFVTTWMESECDKLIMVSINKNHVDIDEYPFTIEPQASEMAQLSPTSARVGGGGDNGGVHEQWCFDCV